MNTHISLTDIKAALALDNFEPFEAQLAMLPLGRPTKRPSMLAGSPRIGAVLLLLYHYQEQFHFVLTKRPMDLNAHGGQISFPGGKQEPNEQLAETALRETYEEIGVAQQSIELLAPLTQIYIPPSDFQVQPFVGWIADGKRPFFQINKNEVDQIIDVPLPYLLSPEAKQAEPREFRGQIYQVPFFAVQEHKVWGATAVMINEFVERLKIVLQSPHHA